MSISFPYTFGPLSGTIPLSYLDSNFSAINSAIGTSAGNLVALDGSARLPAVDGSQLTGIAQSTGVNWTPFNLDDRVWGAGTSAAKTSWTFAGGGSVAKNTTTAQIKGAAGSALTRSGSDVQQSSNVAAYPGWPAINYWQGKTVTYGRWVYATVANIARLSINDGVGSTQGAYHPGDSALHFLTVTRTLSASATQVQLQDLVDTTNGTAVFSGGGFITGSVLPDSLPCAWVGRKSSMAAGIKSAGLLPASTTLYTGPGTGSGTEADVLQYVPFVKAVVRNLFYYTSTQPGGAATHVVTFRTASADTALTCTATGATNTASDTTHEVAITQGANFSLKVVSSTGAASSGSVTATWEVEEVPL